MTPIEPTVPLEDGEKLIRLDPAPGNEDTVGSLIAVQTRYGFLTEWTFTLEERIAIAEGANLNMHVTGTHFHPTSSWVQGVVPT